MRAVQITRFGGPEVLEVVDLPDPVPGSGQQLSGVHTAGVNFADTHHPVLPTDLVRLRAAGSLEPSSGPAVLQEQLGHVVGLCTEEETPSRVPVFNRRAGHRGGHT